MIVVGLSAPPPPMFKFWLHPWGGVAHWRSNREGLYLARGGRGTTRGQHREGGAEGVAQQLLPLEEGAGRRL